MTDSRRSFLKKLGLGAAAAPTLADMSLHSHGLTADISQPWYSSGPNLLNNASRAVGVNPGKEAYGTPEWAFSKLAKRMLPHNKDRRFRQTYVSSFDPDLVSLRSVSLSRKLQIQKKRNFDADEKNKINFFEFIIAGGTENEYYDYD